MPEQTHATSFDPGLHRLPDVLYETPHWYALHTRGRHEKTVDQLFRRKGIESFLPVVATVSQWKDRKKVVQFPMFPGYVFGRFTLQSLPQVLEVYGVAGVVGIRGRPAPILAAEIESVRLLVVAAALAKTTLDRAALVCEGSWVRVAGGPFDGIQGVVVERLGRRRVRVGIRAIGQALEVDLPLADLHPIPIPA
ncbi:MAG TPA: UpxY family transcription antiterminator [Longimicrobium sp.]|nr:UpxY family transcription antiterminator [Longimicrobium sp.]